MIEANLDMFPNNAVELIAIRAASLDPDIHIEKRPLRNTDPTQSFGVSAAQWVPQDESLEIRGAIDGSEPTISQYTLMVQAFVKDADQVRGGATHATFAKMVRTMLYHDTPLAVGLRTLSVVVGSSTERMLKWGIRNQRYFSNELDATWLYLSTLEFWLETETV